MPNTARALRRSLIAAALLVLLGHAAPALGQEPRGDGPPYRVGGDVTRPEIVSNTRPVYTELARRARITGTVIVEAVIDEQGNVTNVRVLKGLPMGLDKAAVDAIQTWKFKPATRQGQPVPVYYVLTVNFQVDDAPFGSGPLFMSWLKQNPEFAARLRDQRYQEAAELLDQTAAERPEDAAIPLARIHLLLAQGRLQEAWQDAMKEQGPARYEMLCSVGAVAWRQTADQDLEAESRAGTLELGLQAETAALETREDGSEAILYKSWLLRTKAELTLDPQERRALIAEAEKLRQQSMTLQKTRDTATAPETRPPGV